MENEVEKQWYTVYTMPRGEKKLKARLDSLGIECYLPLLSVKKKWSDRVKTIDTPLFPSYLFVHIHFDTQAIDILKEPMSVQFIKFEGKPSVLAIEDLDMIRLFIKEYPERLKVEQRKSLKPGKKVEIKFGVFAGREAIVQKVKNAYMVILKIPSLNRSLSVEINKEDLGFS